MWGSPLLKKELLFLLKTLQIASHNARRQLDDDISGTFNLTGPIRYIHYDLSPTDANVVNAVIDASFSTVNDQTGYAQAEMMDNSNEKD